jgi:Ala-tRNA(Pro) deacylase
MSIADYLAKQSVPFETLLHPPAFSASKRASYLHVCGGQVAKAVLLRGPGGYFLAVLPSTHAIDLDFLARHKGGQVRLARVEEVARIFRDCEWGAVSPFGHLYGLPILLDIGLEPESAVFLEAGSHFEDVRLSCRDFERLTGAARLDFARPVKQA